MSDMHTRFADLLKTTTEGLKTITEEALIDIDKNMPKIENEKHKAFAKKNLADVLAGKINPAELLKNINSL